MANTKDLLRAGLLKENEKLIWKRSVQGSTHEAYVSPDGLIHTVDGKSHRTPSGAARHLNGNKPVDGWIAWRVKSSNESLAELRSKLT